MGTRVKGITIAIGGDTTGLNKALEGTEKQISSTKRELKDVERLLKLDPTNTVLLKQKQELLAESISETEGKLKTLNEANKKAAESIKKYDDWKKAYDPIQQEISETQKRLTDLKESQKEALEIHGVDSDEYKKLQDDISKTAKQLKNLKQQAKEVSEEFGNPISKSQYDALQREIIETEIGLEKLKDSAKDVEKAVAGVDEKTINEVSDAAKKAKQNLDDAGKEASDFADYLKADAIVEAGKAIIETMGDIAEESKDYIKIMGSLEVSSQNAGYTAEQTAEIYKQLYGVLADEQAAATTTANLQAIGLSQEELVTMTNMTIGAWSKYGDSIPIDGLAEAINETVKTGQVTGNLADVLNWGTKEGEMFGITLKENIDFTELSSEKLKKMTESEKEEYEARKAQYEAVQDYNASITDATTAEDRFNIALQNAGTEAERADLIMRTLAEQGLAENGEAWLDNEEALVKNNTAQAEMQEQIAKLGETAMPVFTEIISVVTGALEVFNSLDGISQILIVTAGILIGVLLGIPGIITAVTNASTALNAAWAANTAGIVIAGITALVTAFTVLWRNCEGFRNFWIGLWDGIKTGAKMGANGLIGMLNGIIDAMNALIRGANKIKIDVPDWVPNIGGKEFGFNIKTIGKIAYLAKGGTLVDGTAVVGESGPEILNVTGGRANVIPLTGDAAAGKGLNELMGLLNTYLPYLANGTSIVLDNGVLVGELTPDINNELGRLAEMEKYR